MFCQNCVLFPSRCTDPMIPSPEYSSSPRTRVKGPDGFRTHTGAGDTVWQPIFNLYNTQGTDCVGYTYFHENGFQQHVMSQGCGMMNTVITFLRFLKRKSARQRLNLLCAQHSFLRVHRLIDSPNMRNIPQTLDITLVNSRISDDNPIYRTQYHLYLWIIYTYNQWISYYWFQCLITS